MSIVIVTFPGAPKMIQEEVEKDNICNQKIESRIKGMDFEYFNGRQSSA